MLMSAYNKHVGENTLDMGQDRKCVTPVSVLLTSARNVSLRHCSCSAFRTLYCQRCWRTMQGCTDSLAPSPRQVAAHMGKPTSGTPLPWLAEPAVVHDADIISNRSARSTENLKHARPHRGQLLQPLNMVLDDVVVVKAAKACARRRGRPVVECSNSSLSTASSDCRDEAQWLSGSVGVVEGFGRVLLGRHSKLACSPA